MTFGEALEALKRGGRVTRSGWNRQGMWIVLVRPDEGGLPIYPERRLEGYSVLFRSEPDTDYPYALHEVYPRPRLLPWIGMKTADDAFVPWLPSATDLFAEDWEVVS